MLRDSVVKSAEIAEEDVDWSQGAAWIDGRIVPIADAVMPITDWGFLRSDVTYDVVHVWKGAFFRLDDHLARFQNSMRALRMSIPLDAEGIKQALTAVVRRTGLRDAYVSMICTRGMLLPGLPRHPMNCANQFFAYATPFAWVLSPEVQMRGAHAIVARTPRISPESVDPTVKNFHWGDLVRAWFEASDAGVDTPILQDGRGYVTEGPGFNVFAVVDGVVLSPDRGILLGITRTSVFELCDELEIGYRVGRLSVEQLRDADEIFGATTAGGIMPISRLDGRILGNDKPGAITTKLRELYWQKHDLGWHATPIQYD